VYKNNLCRKIYKNIKAKNIKYEYKNEIVILLSLLLLMFYNTKKHSKLYHKLQN